MGACTQPTPRAAPPACSLQVLKRSGTYVHFMPAPTFGMIAKG